MINPLSVNDTFRISVQIKKKRKKVEIESSLSVNNKDQYTVKAIIDDSTKTNGYPGIVGRGLLDFSVNGIYASGKQTEVLNAGINECHTCYALGDTLKKENGHWQVRFISIFRSDGKKAEIRISDQANPKNGWKSVAVAGTGEIINNDFRRNTAIIDVILPYDPSETTMYYTIWKDGIDVTSDLRIETDGVGLGTGIVGDVPVKGDYVGRLPQLKAPYKLCGLSCHAIHGGGPKLPEGGRWGGFFVHDQPTYGAYKHLEDYDFQIMLWEDDIWYMELLLYPPSTDDAYKIVTTSICGPTSRWQMMRHWNVLNPGDHDHGMDDVKGPEQIAIRNNKDLGQDPDYMIRNFQIVSHLMIGKENPSGTDNPKRWRKWKMPNKDFTLMIMDSRLWRSSQDTNIWDDEGWGHKDSLYNRTDPTRSLLGEEQFAWLQENIRTETSPIICLTGINALHTIWKGTYWGKQAQKLGAFHSRDRVAADYAGWVGAGANRILELLGSRSGIVSVYGDVHNGSIIRNKEHNLYECSFGPIGRSGGREVIDGFGPHMKDFDGRELEAIALYHKKYDNVLLEKKEGPFYWNFLEMKFDPSDTDPKINFKIRNLIDSPDETPRGGGEVEVHASQTGRTVSSVLPDIKTLPKADVLLMYGDLKPICGTRSNADGALQIHGLSDVPQGADVLIMANDGKDLKTHHVKTK
ncbi:alkaline phosphatase D family protein [Fulvivirgaceae bacterium BMA10]|uniref:Alkaline phosphatase D family protein n=1 Tax=Splendidivirga corallicola TaxID=3051826 RepID=A0ABT8KQ29_9BACT|nr:alkaline phosphatase D family protein [Fulvivirgaceae bacterium BMA10]